MLDKLMKEDWDNSKYCLRSDKKCSMKVNNADISVSTVPPSMVTGGGDWRPVWSEGPSWTGPGRSVLARTTTYQVTLLLLIHVTKSNIIP